MKAFASLLLLLLPVAAGCGASAANELYDAKTYQGTVDTSLPQDLQAKQQGLARLLNGLQEGVGEEAALRIFVPGVTFREPFAGFFAGAGRLAKWEFNGRPVGNEVPVALHFDQNASGPIDLNTLRREERVYIVAGSGQYVTISRK